jgi:hypothetical protein
MQITMDKNKSDSCEYIYADNLAICKHKMAFPIKILESHEKIKARIEDPNEYMEKLKDLIKSCPVIFHYSWLNLDRKKKNGEFWNQTWHGKKKATYNTTEDIETRITEKKDILLKVNFEHSLKIKE